MKVLISDTTLYRLKPTQDKLFIYKKGVQD